MSIKEKTKEELEQKIKELEDLIAKKGVGSQYLAKVERIQRDVNLALVLGGVGVLLGAAAWSLYNHKEE